MLSVLVDHNLSSVRCFLVRDGLGDGRYLDCAVPLAEYLRLPSLPCRNGNFPTKFIFNMAKMPFSSLGLIPSHQYTFQAMAAMCGG